MLWFIFGASYLLIEKGIFGDLDYYPSTGNPYEFGRIIIVALLFITLTGLLVGTFEIMFLSNLFKRISFGKKILYKSTIYVAIIVTFLFLLTVINNTFILRTHLLDIRVWDNVWTFVFSFAFLSIVVYITVLIGVSLFFSEVSENLGISVLHNFLIGKYHRPVEEERIFMFLDMKSSTTIAEQLGHIKYFEMLKDYYTDFTNAIINYYGEIYQYVRDEIVLSWSLKKGLSHNNCLKCFFALRDSLLDQSQKYKSKYGIVPTFKAGFHIGKATIGEIGELKKEIVFTGDVLNTTARIQALCNTYNVDILISGDLIDQLNLSRDIQIQSLGKSELRGKKELIELFTVRTNTTMD